MEGFIEGVRTQPCLWNPLHPDYREAHMKDEAWQRVIEHYNDKAIPNIQTAKTEWKKLRDNHRDALKRAKLGKNKLLPAQITTWKYAKAMQFLEPHMKYRITEHIDMDPSPGTSGKGTEQDVSTTETNDASESPNKKIKRRCLAPHIDVKAKNDPDALESFFNCILQSTREMPQWMQTQVKKKIFAVVIESEEYLAQYEQNNVTVVETKIKSEVFSDDDT